MASLGRVYKLTDYQSKGSASSQAEPLLPPEEQARQAMMDSGLSPPDTIRMDGHIHRFSTGSKGASNKGGDKSGWYIFYRDGIAAGKFGDWRTGLETPWRADVGRQLTPAEEMAHLSRMEDAKKARDAEIERTRQSAAETVAQIWTSAHSANAEHPYLSRKGVQPHGARITGDGRLVVPLYDQHGELSSLQYIGHDGQKLYHPGGKTGGCYWQVGASNEPGAIYVAEGFATAATIHETTNRPCIVSYSASNLVPVVGTIRERFGIAQEIIVVADHDKSQVGQRYAEQACAKYGARFVMPPIEGDANDYAQAGHDLSELLHPSIKDDWLIPAEDFSTKPAPISWLVKHWLQANAMIMVHGPSGGGKTFAVLDWSLRIASGISDWCGHKVKPGTVVYLAGEGHHGLKGRIAAWRQRHQPGKINMWLSKAGCDLNTPEGYRIVSEHIRALKHRPSLIVVDTLHRFLSGDENSSQDAKTMLDACSALMAEFDCSVLLVHHTGVSDEAQHRARGSSAWRGALDIEISIVPAKASRPIEIVSRKTKDSEMPPPIYASLESVPIDGWLDEDGDQVTSAVIVQKDAPPNVEKKPGKHQLHIQMFESAWWDSGAEERESKPYLSRSGFLAYLVKQGEKESNAKQMIKPSAQGRPVCDLLHSGVINPFEHGWIVADGTLSSALMMAKNAR